MKMKTKRLLLIVSMLACLFSLAGCDDVVEKPFDYDETQLVKATMEYFTSYANVSDKYVDYYLENGTEFDQSAIKGIKQAIETDKVGGFENYGNYNTSIQMGTFDISDVDASIENGADYVTVTILNKAENRDVEISVKYVENKDYYIEMQTFVSQALQYYAQMGYTEDMILAETGATSIEEAMEIEAYLQQQEGIYPFSPEEMVVSAVYSKSELMKQAGMNTIIGMATVFVVLVFISFIISLFKFLPALFAKKPKLPEAKPVEKKAEPVKAAPVKKAEPENLMNDTELVAVITAAIYAMAGSTSNGAVSKDKLVVRSIRRAK